MEHPQVFRCIKDDSGDSLGRLAFHSKSLSLLEGLAVQDLHMLGLLTFLKAPWALLNASIALVKD